MIAEDIDLHQCITEKIIAMLEEGTVPWQTSWLGKEVPQNLLTKRPYRGINVLLLSNLTYARNLFLTESQLDQVGGSVLPGELPHVVVMERSEKKLNPYEVYNISQCRLPQELIPRFTVEDDPIGICHRIVARMPQRPPIVHNNRQLFYMIENDVIDIQELDYYDSVMEFFADLFGALVASTAHKTRLDRTEMVKRGRIDPSLLELENLIQEIGCWFLKSVAGIESQVYTSQAYIRHWVKQMRSNSHIIFTACSLAQEAVDYILGTQVSENDYFEDQELPF